MWSGTSYILGRLREARRGATNSYNCVSVHNVEDIRECYREPGIVGGYRKDYSPCQVIFSLFRTNNETVNFWTHFLPSLYFAWKLISLSYTMAVFSDPYLFPLTCHLITSCAYPLASCLAHAFSCMSPLSTHVCFFLDYVALSMYSWSTSILYCAYTFPDSFLVYSWYSSLFLPVAAFNAVLATLLACWSRFVNPRIMMTLRLLGFTIPYIWDSIPLLYRLMTCDSSTDSCGLSGSLHLFQFAAVGAAVFFYASHIPERYAPGRFDFVGNSHNLLHIFGIAATHEQIRAAIIDLSSRKTHLKNIGWVINPVWTQVVSPALLIVNLLLIIVAIRLLCKVDPIISEVSTSFSCQKIANGFDKSSEAKFENGKVKQH